MVVDAMVVTAAVFWFIKLCLYVKNILCANPGKIRIKRLTKIFLNISSLIISSISEILPLKEDDGK